VPLQLLLAPTPAPPHTRPPLSLHPPHREGKVADPYAFAKDLAAGGTAGALSKTVVAPIERVKLLLQTQDSNPKIKSGEVRLRQLVCCAVPCVLE
jgi:hypothetical protein